MIVTEHSPADILTARIEALPVAIVGTALGWPVTVNRMPEDGDKRIAISDTQPVPDGRLMAGEVIEHPGVQVRVRATIDRVAYHMATKLALAIDEIKRIAVMMPDGRTYRIDNASRKGGIIRLGPEPGTNRYHYTVNAALTITEVLP